MEREDRASERVERIYFLDPNRSGSGSGRAISTRTAGLFLLTERGSFFNFVFSDVASGD